MAAALLPECYEQLSSGTPLVPRDSTRAKPSRSQCQDQPSRIPAARAEPAGDRLGRCTGTDEWLRPHLFVGMGRAGKRGSQRERRELSLRGTERKQNKFPIPTATTCREKQWGWEGEGHPRGMRTLHAAASLSQGVSQVSPADGGKARSDLAWTSKPHKANYPHFWIHFLMALLHREAQGQGGRTDINIVCLQPPSPEARMTRNPKT